ncbi:Leukotriene A-4, partial [Hortaea werneckii]
YEKGFTFLYHLEKLIGKEKWDKFIPHYFTAFKEKSVDSYEFKATLLSFFDGDAEASKKLENLEWDTWFYKPGFPPKPDFDTELADQCYELAKKWEALNGSKADNWEPSPVDINKFTSNQSVVFLETLQSSQTTLKPGLIDLMGKTYGFAQSKNVELVSRYYVLGLQARDEKVYEPAAELLGRIGRMKFVRPVFRELMKCDMGLAQKVYDANKETWHPICRDMVRKMLEKGPKE